MKPLLTLFMVGIVLLFSCQNGESEEKPAQNTFDKIEDLLEESGENPNELDALISPVENVEYPIKKAPYTNGKMVRDVYINDYFGIKLKIPSDWHVMNAEQLEQALNETKENFEKKGESFEEKFDNSRDNWGNLLVMQKEDSLPLFHILAERLDKIPDVDNALEYQEYCAYFFTERYREKYPIYTGGTTVMSRVGDRLFLQQSFQIETVNDLYYQITYSAQFGDYVLSFIGNYYNNAQYFEIEQLVNDLKWME